MYHKCISRWLAPAASLMCASLASGAGYTILEQSVSGLGYAFASGSASSEDASAIFYNPASMGFMDKSQYLADVHYLILNTRFHNTGSTTVSTGSATSGGDSDGGFQTPVPSMYYVQPLSSSITVGFSINAPFGLGTEYDDGWVGRYTALTSKITTYDVSPSIAWKINDKLSIGVGIDIYYVSANLTNAIDFNKDGTTLYDGKIDMNADDQAIGGHAGIIYQVRPSTRIGFAYRSQVSVNLIGDADFTIPEDYLTYLNYLVSLGYISSSNISYVKSTFSDQGVGATLKLPASASLSVVQGINDKLDLMADITWTDWSCFYQLDLGFENATTESVAGKPVIENWQDTFRYSVGANYKLNDKFKLRFGLCYDETAIRSAEYRSPRIPDSSRFWISTGLGWQMSANSHLDFAYVHIFVSDSDVNNSLHTSNQVLVGTINSSMDIISMAYSYSF